MESVQIPALPITNLDVTFNVSELYYPHLWNGVNISGWPKHSFGFSVRYYGKSHTNELFGQPNNRNHLIKVAVGVTWDNTGYVRRLCLAYGNCCIKVSCCISQCLLDYATWQAFPGFTKAKIYKMICKSFTKWFVKIYKMIYKSKDFFPSRIMRELWAGLSSFPCISFLGSRLKEQSLCGTCSFVGQRNSHGASKEL